MVKKVCIISGAASGIGKATLQLFLLRDYICIGLDKDEAGLQKLVQSLRKEERERTFIHAVDLLQEEIIREKLEGSLNKFEGEIRLTLVNNIGGSNTVSKKFEELSWEEFHQINAFNLKPLHTLTRLCLPVMKFQGYGNIVNVSSISARKALKNVGADYAAAKAAIIGLSRHLAQEVAEAGIVVNTVCPGIIGTERILKRWDNRDQEINHKVLETIPLNRLGTPSEVAEAIVFLGSANNRYITGAVLDVNGGMFCP